MLPAPPPASYLVAHPTGAGVALRAAPGGAVLTTLGSRGLFGGPLELGVVQRRGRWLGVTSELLPNGRLGWIDARRVAVSTVDTAIRIDLAVRRLTVMRAGRIVRRIAVAVGRSRTPTPVGRFAIAEKLPGTRYSAAVYGCCILALSARQSHPPAGWDPRQTYYVAIHGGTGIGAAASAGCLHASERDLRWLMRTVPLGTPVFIRSR